ncbi:cytochrome P450 89A2-like [Iris pallida]|uniref:Cytochrome P450 89A2-like n=1 Tax=Iris pallida TaxID=29817 RepID=A0AAX6DZZ3_IRIPA|nr:cytochrome P450 89A2-like [Iris pallida]
MEAWVLFFLAISLVLSLKLLLPKLINPSSRHNKPTLPPGPPAIPFVLKTTLQRTSLFQLELVLRQLHSKYGPIVALRIPFRPTVFISDRGLAHEALVHAGAALADRPPVVRGPRAIVSNHADITSSSYGPLWRSLRRNLAAEMLHPSRVRLFSRGREWALRILLDKLRLQSENGDRAVGVMESFQFAMFSLLVLMCFGEKLDEKALEEVQSLQYYFLRLFVEFNPFAVLPAITRHVFRRRWDEIAAALRRQEEIFIPLIRSRQQRKLGRRQREGESAGYSYVDSLLDVELEGGRRLREDEIASLCHEFLSGGTDTTSTALQWIMAELVRNREAQGRLHEEVEAAAAGKDGVEEEDLQRMPYLKAVIAEALRRHPPGHFVLPHRAAKDVVLGGGRYLIPKGAEVHINVAELGWDGRTWEEPMAFRPERFLEGGDGSGVDITGSREIKMMPFGAGRRMCPGFGLALLHLEYFVANLVREFEWKAAEGEEVDLSERLEFTTVMKYPLRARICSRRDR